MKIASGMNRLQRVRNSRTFVKRNRCCSCGGSSSGGAMSGRGDAAPAAASRARARLRRRPGEIPPGHQPGGFLEHLDVRNQRRRALLLVTSADERLVAEPRAQLQRFFGQSSLADAGVAEQQDEAAPAGLRLVEALQQLRALGVAPDQPRVRPLAGRSTTTGVGERRRRRRSTARRRRAVRTSPKD